MPSCQIKVVVYLNFIMWSESFNWTSTNKPRYCSLLPVHSAKLRSVTVTVLAHYSIEEKKPKHDNCNCVMLFCFRFLLFVFAFRFCSCLLYNNNNNNNNRPILQRIFTNFNILKIHEFSFSNFEPGCHEFFMVLSHMMPPPLCIFKSHSLRGSTSLASIRIFFRILLPCPTP